MSKLLLLAAGIIGEHRSTLTLVVWEALHEEWDDQLWRHSGCRGVTVGDYRYQD